MAVPDSGSDWSRGLLRRYVTGVTVVGGGKGADCLDHRLNSLSQAKEGIP
jgi:hypothetical protein